MSKNIDTKKISTVPYGRGCLAALYICAIVIFVLGIVKLTDNDDFRIGVGILGICLFVFVPIIILMHYHNCDSYVEFGNGKIQNKNKVLTWDEAYLTVHCHELLASRFVFVWVYFDKRYLTEKEVRSFRIRRQGLCLRMNMKRLDSFISNCKREIKVLNDTATNKDVLMAIYMYNDRF